MRRTINILNILALCASVALLPSCGEKAELTPDPGPDIIDNTGGEDLLQSIHLTRIYNYKLDNVLIHNVGYEHRLSGKGSFEQYYSVIPLYAFRSDRSNYVGDFYIIDATFSVASSEMYAGLFRDREDSPSGPGAPFVGFFLTGYSIDISLVDDKGDAVPVRFNQMPSPSTTINSTTYTSGVNWSFEAGLSGGAVGSELSFNYGCSFSSSKTREVRDLSIKDTSSDGSVHYSFEIKNLPAYFTPPPAISRATFDLHTGWVWSVDNTAESDTTTYYRMKVKMSQMNYRAIHRRSVSSKEYTQNWPIDSKEFYFNLPIPNRVPCGNVKFVNSEKETYMTGIVFTEADAGEGDKKTYADLSGSVYYYQEYYEAGLPEGTYKVSYKLGGTDYSGENIVITRGETLEIQSGYYK